MPHATIDGVRIWYEERGEGPPLVLVQGLGNDHRPYHWLRERLVGRARTVVLDNRGTGESDVPEGPYTIERMADDVAGLLDHLGIERTHLMGISLGGYVALAFAIRHPGRLARLVVGCSYMVGSPERLEMPGETVEVLTSREGTPEEIARRGLAIALSERFRARRPDVFEEIVRFRVERPTSLEGYMAQLQAGMTFDAEAGAAGIAAPTLVIHGDDDRVVPVARGRELASTIPGARLEILEGVGHQFFVEEPERTADLVASFIGAGS